jgi:hypothetical protein
MYAIASTGWLCYRLGLEHAPKPVPFDVTDFIQANKEQVNNVCYVWWFKTPPKEKVRK